jgi:hypothetical protein
MARNASPLHHVRVAPQPAYDVAIAATFTDQLEPLTNDGAVTLEDVLGAVREFGSASIELVAWEFSVSEDELIGVWDQAVGEGLLRPVGDSRGTGEQMYAFAEPGHARTSAHCRSVA